MALYKPSAQQIALACGAAGTYVDVTDDLVTDSVKGTWGRNSAFSDTRPGVFSFDLVNDSGKYTPGNPSSSLATPVRVGMGVSHVVDGMHFAGTIRSTQPYFTGPDGMAGSAKIRVTCDDVLGNASRRELSDLSTDIYLARSPYLWWTFGDPAGSTSAASSPLVPAQPSFVSNGGAAVPIFGVAPISGYPETQMRLTTPGGIGGNMIPAGIRLQTIPYTSRKSTWGMWVTTNSDPLSGIQLDVTYANSFNSAGFTLSVISGGVTIQYLAGGGASTTATVGPHYFEVTVEVVASLSSRYYATPYLDGVAFGPTAPIGASFPIAPTNAEMTPFGVSLSLPFTNSPSGVISNLTLVPGGTMAQYGVGGLTEASLLQSVAATMPELALDTLPAELSPAPLGVTDFSGSALDAVNDVIRTEQGYVWAETTGTLTSPVQKVKVRERTRGATVDAAHTFDVSEILNAPEFTTDIENMVSTATARGPVESATVTDSNLTPFVGSASDSSTVLLRDEIDVLSWAQDRLVRGAATDVRLPQITIDALRVNRWADISALRPGDRIRVTGLPAALGVSYIDGWMLGSTYSLRYPSLHSEDQLLFTFYLQPVLSATAVYDTNRYMAGGELSLSSTINSSVTSISVATTGSKFTTTGSDLPLNIIIGSEEMTVTAATSATPQVLTVTRAQNGTSAASHTSGALVEIATASLYAF